MTLLTRIRRRTSTRDVVPWGAGYGERRWAELARLLGDPATLGAFRAAEPLPPGHGVALDERCVELPWLVAMLGAGAGRTLDAGSALNHAVVLDAVLPLVDRLDVVTLAPEAECHWRRGVSYLFEDLRLLPFRDDLYDTVACVSTLEHVGFDNTPFSHDPLHRERAPMDFLDAVRELRRVTAPGGRLLLTVPFGRRQQFAGFQQFDLELLERAVDAYGPAEAELGYYRYTSQGWELSDAAGCADAEYVEWVAAAWSGARMPQPPPVESDGAAAARAVACCVLVAG